MKKNNTKIIFFILCLLIFELVACSSNKKNIVGKYVNIFDESHYIIFNEDGSFIDNFLTTTSKGNTSISDCYIYQIDDNGLITVIDTTEYEGQDSPNKYELGWIYNNYICSLWTGILPIKPQNATITCTLNGLTCEYSFNDNKVYEYTVTSDEEILHTENGTYSINNDEVICTNKNKQAITFINIEDNICCIEYVKE